LDQAFRVGPRLRTGQKSVISGCYSPRDAPGGQAMPDAISYKRFSAPRQAWGDSFRRQTDLAIGYCQRHNLRLIDTYLDAGLSAYNGQNLNDGTALKMLLDAAKEGKFAPGTHLIVESLDRLSRSEISMAVRLFLDILEMGLVIVTLIDGEQVFTKERVDNDMTALIIPIVILSRANNEARNRRARIAEARQNILKRAREFRIPITSKCPAWLVVTGRRNARRFVVDESRAEIVRQVFTLAAGPNGQNRLAQLLNEKNIPTLTDKPTWRTAMVAHLLRDPAVLGTYHPKHRVYEDGVVRRVLDPDGPIHDYFPRIVPQELWEAARVARTGRQPTGRLTHERQFSNLVPRLGRCAICGDLLALTHGGTRVPYLRCTASKYAVCPNRLGFPYRKLEPVLLSLDILTAVVARLVAEWLADEEIARRVVKLEARIARAKNNLETLTASVNSKRDYNRLTVISPAAVRQKRRRLWALSSEGVRRMRHLCWTRSALASPLAYSARPPNWTMAGPLRSPEQSRFSRTCRRNMRYRVAVEGRHYFVAAIQPPSWGNQDEKDQVACSHYARSAEFVRFGTGAGGKPGA
jgi:DNA invertase Pin-like site-specific DNA recombinase